MHSTVDTFHHCLSADFSQGGRQIRGLVHLDGWLVLAVKLDFDALLQIYDILMIRLQSIERFTRLVGIVVIITVECLLRWLSIDKLFILRGH